jgi:hypothetical protein
LLQSKKSKRAWKQKNKEICRESDRDFRQLHPTYYRDYRARHPEYEKRNREQTKWRLKRRRKRQNLGLQSRIDISKLMEKTEEYSRIRKFAKWNRWLSSQELGKRASFFQIGESP